MAKYIVHGTVVTVNTAAIANVKSVEFFSAVTPPVDITTLDSANFDREFTPGLDDPGTFVFTIVWDAALAGHIALTTLHTARSTFTTTITHPDGAKTTSFSGFVTEISPQGGESEAVQMMRVAIKATGAITWPA